MSIDGAEFRGVPIAPSNATIVFSRNRLHPADRRTDGASGLIPFDARIRFLNGGTLATVKWSAYNGGNEDDTPPSGTQVVGPIELQATEAKGPSGRRTSGTAARPAATVWVYDNNNTEFRPGTWLGFGRAKRRVDIAERDSNTNPRRQLGLAPTLLPLPLLVPLTLTLTQASPSRRGTVCTTSSTYGRPSCQPSKGLRKRLNLACYFNNPGPALNRCHIFW